MSTLPDNGPVESRYKQFTRDISQQDLTTIIETTAKVFAVILGILYVFGLLVSNAYLTTLGITDFFLLRVRCVFTGLWAVPMTVIACLPLVGFFSNKSFEEFRKPSKSKVLPFVAYCLLYIILEAFFAGFAVAINGYLLQLLSDVSGPSTEILGWSVGPDTKAAFSIEKDVVIAVALVCGVLILVRWNIRRRILLVVAMITAFVGLPIYAYPIVRDEYGGGAPIKVQVVFTKDTPDLSQLIVDKNTGQIGNDISLLYENENSIVLREETSKRLLIIDRKAIVAISPLLH